MTRSILRVAFGLSLLLCTKVRAQDETENSIEWQFKVEDSYLHTSDGMRIMRKSRFLQLCYSSMGVENQASQKVCNCLLQLTERRYSSRRYNEYSRRYGDSSFSQLLQEDRQLQSEMTACTRIQAMSDAYSMPQYQQAFVSQCVANFRDQNKKVSDSAALRFCQCAAGILYQRKIPPEQTADLNDPSTLLFNEVAWRCGSPLVPEGMGAQAWQPSDTSDISGNLETDTVTVITLSGMHLVKATIGQSTRVWMIDSGASDLLVSEDYEKELRKAGLLSDADYVGTGSYTLADETRLDCRKYHLDQLRIGRFTVHNLVLASSPKVRQFLLGKSLWNKFSQWTIDNRRDVLILKR